MNLNLKIFGASLDFKVRKRLIIMVRMQFTW